MKHRPALRAAGAGLAYCAVVFAAGFALGTLRVLVLLPRHGEITAVLLELPVILALSWMACRWLAVRFDVAAALSARLTMGVTAFLSLMVAELGVSVIGFGRSLPGHLDHYLELPALMGLAGQILFAAFPSVQITAAGDTTANPSAPPSSQPARRDN